MSTEVQLPPEQTAASLVAGILTDLQHLVRQQFQLTRREIENELRRRAAAAVICATGGGVCFIGAIVFCLALAHLLHWTTSPTGLDPAGFPLWACYSAVAAVLGLAGGILVQVGRIRFRAIDQPQNLATAILQEQV